MAKVFKLIKKHFNFIVVLLFIISRLYFLTHPAFIEGVPHRAFSDVKHYYERYANMWYYGLTPYLEHYYEYPPATIPLLLMPLVFDQWGIGKYYFNYRVQTFFIDILLFLVILKVIEKLDWGFKRKLFSFVFYFLAFFIAKDYIYEGIDLAFITALFAAVSTTFLKNQAKFKNRIVFWCFFWLSVAVKFLSLPLLLPFLFLKKLDLKKEIASCTAGALIIWIIPLLLFRTSLSVSVVFHLQRKMKYSSFPYFIVYIVNLFTKSETKMDIPPDFSLVGPVSDFVQPVFTLLLFVSVLIFLFAAFLKTKNSFLGKEQFNKKQQLRYYLSFSLIVVFLMFIFGKVHSAPFHLWYIPLITIFPFQQIKNKVFFMGTAIWSLILNVTDWLMFYPNIIVIEPFNIDFFVTCLRFLPFFILLYLALRMLEHSNKPQKH